MLVQFHDVRIATLPLGIVIFIVLLVISWRKKRSPSYLFCFAVFGAYILFALDKAFFPIVIDEMMAQANTFEGFLRAVNLIPFNFDFAFIPHMVWLQIVMNSLLTVPFGFGLNFVAPVRAKDFLWLSLAVGLGIETIQLIVGLLLGYPYRIIDVNDAILNALGVLIGYGIFRIFARLYLWAMQRLGIRHRGLAAYVYEVAKRTNATSTSPVFGDAVAPQS
jgi:glycopeptide antibiotics resistance protein